MIDLIIFLISLAYILFFFGWWRQWILDQLEDEFILELKDNVEKDPEQALNFFVILSCLLIQACCSIFFLLLSSFCIGGIAAVHTVKFLRPSGLF